MSELQNAVNSTFDYIESLEQQIAELNRRDDKLTNLLLQICKLINPEATVHNVNEIIGSNKATVRFLDILQQHNFMGEPAETWYNRYGDTKAKLAVLRNDLDTLVNKLNNYETIVYTDFGDYERIKQLMVAIANINQGSDSTSQKLTETNTRYKSYLASIERAAYGDNTTADTLDDSESNMRDLIYDIGEYSTFFKHHRHESAGETNTVGTEDEVIVLRNYLKRIFEAAYPYMQIQNDNYVFCDSDIDKLVDKITKNKQAACELVSQKARDLVTEEIRKEQKNDFEMLSNIIVTHDMKITRLDSEIKALKTALSRLRKDCNNE